MLEFEYKGGNTVVVATKQATIVTDPKLSLVGLKDVTVKDKIVLATEQRFIADTTDAKLVIDGPGEFGVADFDIKGVAAARHLDEETATPAATIYRIEANDIRVAVLGNIAEKLSEEQLEELGVIDVLVVPVGGSGYTLDPTGAAGLVRAIDPKAVIPVHYADSALKYEVPQGDFETFSSELGVSVEETPKYKLKNAAALPQTLTVVKVTRT